MRVAKKKQVCEEKDAVEEQTIKSREDNDGYHSYERTCSRLPTKMINREADSSNDCESWNKQERRAREQCLSQILYMLSHV